MMIISPKVPESQLKTVSFSDRNKSIVAQILQEENVDFSQDVFKDAVLFMYASQDKNHSNAIEMLYSWPEYDLRHAVLSVISVYHDHSRSDITRVPVLLGWLAVHMEGIGWTSDDDYTGPARLNPSTPEHGLSELYEILLDYNESADMIDRYWAHPDDRKYQESMGAVPGEEYPMPIFGSHIIDHQTYKLARSGWFTAQANDIKEKLESHNMSPSGALGTLIKYWDYYTGPGFRNISNRIDYIVRSAAEFPDSSELRMEFRRIVNWLSQPNK